MASKTVIRPILNLIVLRHSDLALKTGTAPPGSKVGFLGYRGGQVSGLILLVLWVAFQCFIRSRREVRCISVYFRV